MVNIAKLINGTRGEYNSFDKKALGAYIRERRTERGIAVRELAAHCERHGGYISNIEYGHYDYPSEGVLKKIAEKLHIDADDLLRRAGQIDSNLLALLFNDQEVIGYLREKYESNIAKGYTEEKSS